MELLFEIPLYLLHFRLLISRKNYANNLPWRSFLYFHLRLVDRVIGPSAKSLKGRRSDALNISASQHLFPELWAIRTEMTEAWSEQKHTIEQPVAVACEQ